MTDVKITDLPVATEVGDDDVLPMVDVSDTTLAPSGTNKQLPLPLLRAFIAANGGGGVVAISRSDYEALDPPVPGVLYVITGA